MPLVVAALIAVKTSDQNCMATNFPLGPVPWSSMRITSPAPSWFAALLMAPAVLNTPLMMAE
jgi:hypothetical protein